MPGILPGPLGVGSRAVQLAGPGAALRPVYLRQPDARMGAGASLLAARR